MSARSNSQRLLLALLLCGTGALLVDSSQYPPAIRLFPLIVLGALAVAVAMLLLADVHAGVGRFVGRLTQVHVAGAEAARRDADITDTAGGQAHEQEAEQSRERVRTVGLIAWILGLVLVSTLAGFLVAVPVFLIAFPLLKSGSISEARRVLPSAIVLTLGMMLFIYAIFVLVLGLPLSRPLLY